MIVNWPKFWLGLVVAFLGGSFLGEMAPGIPWIGGVWGFIVFLVLKPIEFDP